MNAIGFMEFGGPEVLRVLDLPKPDPAPGEVLVRVAASTINPSDLMMRSGQQAAFMKGLNPPFVAGMEFSGHISEVGVGVKQLTLGQPIMGVVNPRRTGGGAHAEYVCVSEKSVTALDGLVNMVEASTVPMNGLTALAALDMLNLKAGESVLISGGAGVLAAYVIQLANARGLQVVADAREAAWDRLRQLGVRLVVPRGEDMAAAVRAAFPNGVDGLIDTALLGDKAAALVRDGGAALSLRRSHPINDHRLRCGYVAVTDHMTDADTLNVLAESFRHGRLLPTKAQQFVYSESRKAHELMEIGRLTGRAVLDFCESPSYVGKIASESTAK